MQASKVDSTGSPRVELTKESTQLLASEEHSVALSLQTLPGRPHPNPQQRGPSEGSACLGLTQQEQAMEIKNILMAWKGRLHPEWGQGLLSPATATVSASATRTRAPFMVLGLASPKDGALQPRTWRDTKKTAGDWEECLPAQRPLTTPKQAQVHL